MGRRLVVALGTLVLVVVCILIAVVVRTQPSGQITPPPPTPTNTTVPAKRAQSTMMVGVRDDGGKLADAVMMGSELSYAQVRPAAGSWLSLQPGLELDIGVEGVITLADEGPWDPGDSSGQVGNQLGVHVDGGFIMDRLAFAAMVDAVGGVTVNVSTLVTHTAPDGTTQVVARRGVHKMFGPAAAQYVISIGPNESQQARMERFNQVWQQVILTLPGNIDRVRSIVGSLGSSSRISLPPDQIAEMLLTYQTAITDRTVKTAIMPASAGTGVGVKEVFTADPTATAEVAKELFESSLVTPGVDGEKLRVRLLAAGLTNAMSDQAKSAILQAGFTFVWGGALPAANTSLVFVPNQASRVTVATPLIDALGLPNSALRVDPAQTPGVQGAVTGGADLFKTTHSPSASVSGSVSGVTP